MDTEVFMDKYSKLKPALITILTLALSAAMFAVGMLAGIGETKARSAAASRSLTAEISAFGKEVDLADALRVSTVNAVIEEESIPAYTNAQIRKLDVSKPSGVTKSDLKLVTQGALVGLEDAFLKAEQDYGINCLFVMAIASHESANGTICFRPNNMFGFGRSGFSSKAEGIDVVSRALARNYLSPGGSLYSEDHLGRKQKIRCQHHLGR